MPAPVTVENVIVAMAPVTLSVGDTCTLDPTPVSEPADCGAYRKSDVVYGALAMGTFVTRRSPDSQFSIDAVLAAEPPANAGFVEAANCTG